MSSCCIRFEEKAMKRKVFGVAAVVGGLLFVARPDAGAQAQGDAIRVLISNGLKTSLEALRTDAESAVTDSVRRHSPS